MNRWWRLVLIIIGSAMGAFVVVWWISDRRVPTLRFSHTIGRGNDVNVEWIRIK
jgi:hypothetical protein